MKTMITGVRPTGSITLANYIKASTFLEMYEACMNNKKYF